MPRFPPVSVLFCDIRLRWRAHRIKPTANVDPAVAFPTEVASSRCTDRSGGPFEQGRFCVAASDREPVARAAGDLTHRLRIYIPENELLSLHCLVAPFSRHGFRPGNLNTETWAIPMATRSQAPKASPDLRTALQPFLTLKGLFRRPNIGRKCLVSLKRARCNLAFTVPTGTPKIRATSLTGNPCT